MTSNGSANVAPRGTRAKELDNAETGARNDILTIVLANGASYDSKERVVLRRLSLEIKPVAKWRFPAEIFAERQLHDFVRLACRSGSGWFVV
jgi:hypothetical protein